MLFEVLSTNAQAVFNSELDEILSLAVGVFALVLLAVTLAAYKKTNLTRLLLVSSAFGLFAVKTILRHLDILIFNWGTGTMDLLFTALDFMILVLFFLALTIKK